MNTTTTETTPTVRDPFTKVVRIGTFSGALKSWPIDQRSVYCKIQWDGKKMSITGVEGPMRNGDARGGCCQIVMHEWNIVEYAEGWDPETEAKFRALWERWHMNDARPGCEHQREWPTTEKVEIVTYKLTGDALVQQRKIREHYDERLQAGESVTMTLNHRKIMRLPYETTQAPDADGPGSGRYEVAKRETKALGWLLAHEHPRGLLCKPCPECGYKYGSAWLHEDVPDDVLAWLRALPSTDISPFWV